MKLLKIAGVATVALMALSWKKITDYSHVINEMVIYLRNLDLRSLQTKLVGNEWMMYFKLDVVFFNPTDTDFNFDTAGLIEVKKIELLYKGSKIGEANSSVSAIYLPAQTAYALEAVPFAIVLNNTIKIWLETGFDTNLANFSVIVHVRAMGKTFIIEQ